MRNRPLAALLVAACSGGTSSLAGTHSTGSIGGKAFSASSAVAAVSITGSGNMMGSLINLMISDQPIDCAGVRASSSVLTVAWTQSGVVGAESLAIGRVCDKCADDVLASFVTIDGTCNGSNPDHANPAGTLSIEMSDASAVSGTFDNITFPDGMLSGTFVAQICDSFAAGLCH
jgi:hypothetical protein